MNERSPALESVLTLAVTAPPLFDNFQERRTTRQKIYAILRPIKRVIFRLAGRS